MGSKRTTVGTSVSRAIKDSGLPNAVKTGVTKALFKNGEMIDYVLEEVVSSIGVRAERMYEYAKTGAYVHGLPSGQFTTGEDGLAQVTAVLDALEGASAVIHYSHYGVPNNLHIGWMRLLDTHGYNPATNQLAGLTTTKGTPVYLKDMVVVVPASLVTTIERQSLQQWSTAANSGYTPERVSSTTASRDLMLPTPVLIETGGTSEYLRVKYVWVDLVFGVQESSFTIPVTGYTSQADYFHVKYVVGGVTKYWMYRDGAGTYPALDAVFDRVPEPNGSFFPFAYFRFDNVSEITNKTTDAYKTSKKLVKYLGMNYDQVANAIDQNPDIGTVKQAMLMMAVPANTSNNLERRYLWEFFNNMYLALDVSYRFRNEEEARLAGVDLNQFGLDSPGLVIQDTRFKLSIDNSGIYKRRVAGVIGAVGAYASGIADRLTPIKTTDPISGETTDTLFHVKYHYYRRQISKGFYDEIEVVSLLTRFHIFGEYTAIGDGDDAILLIPLDHVITERYSLQDREVLYARSLHYVFNSLVVTDVAWYQTDFFQFVILVVAVIIIIASQGSAITEALALIAAGSYVAAAILLGTILLEQLFYSYLFKLFVKAVGIKAAIVIAIVAAMAGVVGALDAGTIAGAPWAKALLTLASGIVGGINAQLKSDMGDLLGEAEQFQSFEKEQLKLLDTAKALLEGNNHLDPFVIFGESPEDFYNRTVHSGNIGVVGIDAISAYVDMSLTLPKLNDTLGDGYAWFSS